MTPEQKARAVEFVTNIYCVGSDDNIETDAETNDADFSEGEDGAWVRGWLFVPRSVLEGL